MSARPLLLGILLLTLTAPHARAATRTLHQVRRNEYDAESTFLVFAGGSPLARFANKVLEDWARAQQRQFVALARHDFADGDMPAPPRGGDSPRGYDYALDTVYRRDRPGRLYSVKMDQTQDTGGAHPNTFGFTFNFGLVGGRPRRLTLGDFFRLGSHYRGRVQGLILAKLHQDPRAEFVGQYRSLTPAQLNRFVVGGGGLRFYFDPYEFGPHAAGPIGVTLTAPELGPDFRPGGGT